jgi:hypothetical protein
MKVSVDAVPATVWKTSAEYGENCRLVLYAWTAKY